MNRSLIVPAGFCFVVFTVLLASLHGKNDQATAAVSTKLDAVIRYADRVPIVTARAEGAFDVPNVHEARLLSVGEAQELLSKLADEYLRPWRQWETSPHHLYSRAAPRPIPSIFAEIVMAPTAKGQNGSFLLGAVALITDVRSQPIPCVVDRMTKRAWMCVDGQWISEHEWLKKAPLP